MLVAGGATGPDSFLNSAELYDPVSDSWTPTKPLGTARVEHTATRLPSGQVLIAGGRIGRVPLSSVELYDPEQQSWVNPPPLLLATARYAHTATLLLSGQLLIAGGTNGIKVFDGTEVYDPALGSWSPGPTLGTTLFNHTATPLPSGQVLVAGGITDDDRRLDNVQVYQDATSANDAYPPPIIHPILRARKPGDTLELTGARLHGRSEASGGNAHSSGSTLPLISLMAVEGGALTRASEWISSSDATHTLVVPSVQTGYYFLSITTHGASSGQLILVDATPPAAPQVTKPSQDQNIYTTRRPHITGTAEPGTTMRVTLEEAESVEVLADATGAWSYTPSSSLTIGDHTVTVTATDEAGNTSEPASVGFRIVLPVSHYGWSCAAVPTLPTHGLWLVMALWLRRRGRSKREETLAPEYRLIPGDALARHSCQRASVPRAGGWR